MKFRQIAAGEYELDLTDEICPYPEVYSVRFAEKMKSGNHLRILIADRCSLEGSVQALRERGFDVREDSPSPGLVVLEVKS